MAEPRYDFVIQRRIYLHFKFQQVVFGAVEQKPKYIEEHRISLFNFTAGLGRLGSLAALRIKLPQVLALFVGLRGTDLFTRLQRK